jgi:F5/8 type C domain-containing protein
MSARTRAGGLAVVAIAAACAPRRGPDDPPRTLDAFEDLAPWRATGSDGVMASVAATPGVHGHAMRLAFDLGHTAGYAIARRDLPLDLPDDFALAFELRGDVPINNLELKLIDQTGDNVWWFHRANFAFPASWRHMVVTRRQIEFAWGPTVDHTLRRIAAIELVVSTGQGGGAGWIEIDDLVLHPRAPRTVAALVRRATASSARPGHPAALAIDGAPGTAWHSDPADGAAQVFTLDLGDEREVGGLVVRWAPDGHATDYTVAVSRDGWAWQPAGVVHGGDGGLDPFVFPALAARYVRLALARGAAAGYQLAELAVVEDEGAASPDAAVTAFVEALGTQLPRGSLPRGMSGEQPYWTIAGVDGGGGHNSLLSEDGAVELASGATIEPFVEISGEISGETSGEISGETSGKTSGKTSAKAAGDITSWATAGEITQSLADGYLPIPSVTWRRAAWELTVTALAIGDPARSQLAARYTLRNRAAVPITARIVLAVRPFQVNPPRQFLNLAGGVRRIARIAWADGALAIDGRPALRPLAPPDHVSLWPFHALGYPIAPIAPTPASIDDPAGLASGALAYDLAVPPGGEASIVVVAPLAGDPPAIAPTTLVAPTPAIAPTTLVASTRPPTPAPTWASAWFDAQLATARAEWHARLDRVGFRVPASGRAIIDALRSSLAYMLLSRDGPILRPGTRSYARAWIRDGAMIGEALLRLGHPDVAAAFLRWYAPSQFASGKVPCCVEAHGAVPVPEHDSHGELIHLAAEVWRYTRDRDALAAAWPHVEAAARYLDELRRSERTPANQTPARRAQYGLLPPSISHEGYSARPAYSYWDDFWGLVGYRDAAWLAGELGDPAAATRLAAARDDFEHDLLASIAASAADHHVGYIPGAADLGDFDATSTTIALSPGGELAALPPALVDATFERAWQALVDRHPGSASGGPAAPTAAWEAYTPYELRLVGAFVRLGWRRRAQDALAWYLADQRPRGWNQWAEVVGRLPRAPRFVGDMPHAWVHSDYARSALDLFAYERAADHAIVLAAGIDPAWFAEGFALDRLPTPYGPLSYDVTATAGAITVRIGPGTVPPGGLVLAWPLPTPPGAAQINGTPARWRGATPELSITTRPATIVLSRSGDVKHL